VGIEIECKSYWCTWWKNEKSKKKKKTLVLQL
jgi:hypothetical protein